MIAITTTTRQIPAEHENGQFSRCWPSQSRGRVVLGKFAGCWATCGALLVFYLFFVVVSGSRENSGH